MCYAVTPAARLKLLRTPTASQAVERLCLNAARSWCRMDPLWNSLVIAGMDGSKPFLGSVNMIGVAFTDGHLATGEMPDSLRTASYNIESDGMFDAACLAMH